MTRTKRIASIDVFRALTMLLMIWVNDFWTLDNVPKWLEHAHQGEDFLGFSDLIFPWFLFIVGLSIPYAIENRMKKGASKLQISYHILLRTIALLIMGFFHVNFESYSPELTGVSKAIFVIIATTAFFLIWNRYPVSTGTKKYLYPVLQVIGLLILLILAWFYRGNGEPVTMSPQWWGILGLIGWTYLMTAFIYLLLYKHKAFILLIFFVFILLNIATDLGTELKILSVQPLGWLIGNGSLHTMAVGGILTSLMLNRFSELQKRQQLYSGLIIASLVFLAAGFVLHKHIIISKISGTATWVMFCLSTAVFLLAFLHWLVDHLGKDHWFGVIKTAGTATLTCYLIPYFYYSFRSLLHIDLKGFITNGAAGLLKSMIFAFIIVGITWLLGKLKIQLKI